MKEKKGSNQNATKHGVFAQILLKGNPFGEDREDFSTLVSMLREAIRPVNGLEETLVEKLAVLFFRLTRLYKADMKIAPKMFARVEDDLASSQPATEARWISPEDQVLVIGKNPTTDSMIRYEVNLERQIGRALGQIEALRRMPGGNSGLTLPAGDSERSRDKRETVS